MCKSDLSVLPLEGSMKRTSAGQDNVPLWTDVFSFGKFIDFATCSECSFYIYVILQWKVFLKKSI
jgi:hypothetical protein